MADSSLSAFGWLEYQEQTRALRVATLRSRRLGRGQSREARRQFVFAEWLCGARQIGRDAIHLGIAQDDQHGKIGTAAAHRSRQVERWTSCCLG